MRRCAARVEVDTDADTRVGSADGPLAGHALGQIVRNKIDAREGRERPRRGRGGYGCEALGWGSFTPLLLSVRLVVLGLVAAQTAASVRRGVSGNSQAVSSLRHQPR